jgi:hypothetical protein
MVFRNWRLFDLPESSPMNTRVYFNNSVEVVAMCRPPIKQEFSELDNADSSLASLSLLDVDSALISCDDSLSELQQS